MGLGLRLYGVHYPELVRISVDSQASNPIPNIQDASGRRQIQYQPMLTTNRFLSRRLMLSSRLGVHFISRRRTTLDPWPLVANIGLTAQLGKF